MAQMKRLLIDLIEFEDEIIQLLALTIQALPTGFALLFDDDLPARDLACFLRQFSKDEELVKITVTAIEFDMVDFGNIPDEGMVLSLKIPNHSLTNTIV